MISCRGCGSAGLEIVLSLGNQPLANAYLDDAQGTRPEARFPLEMAYCPRCSLVQLSETVEPDLLFRDYPYFSSVSDAFLDHAGVLARRIVAAHRLSDASLVVEVGSNDGYLLKHYADLGVRVLGVDPARNVAEVAVARGIPTVADFFTRSLAEELRTSGHAADVVHANNVIAHVPDIHDTIAGLARILKPDGIVIIETPYIRDLIERVEFDTIYHEHVFYYSLATLAGVLQQHGLEVIDVERIPVHGGSLRVTASHAGSRTQPTAAVIALSQQEADLRLADPGYYQAFASRVEGVGADLRRLLGDLKARGQSVAAYGAAAKGTVLLNAFDIGTETLDFVADRSPHKQGKYMPGKHVPIVDAGQLLARAPDACLLLAWNFADEVLTQQQAYRDSGGRFVVPVPTVRYLD